MSSQFKKLITIINRLLVNRGPCLKYRVVKLLMLETSRYEQKSDRAFKIIGQYPLTSATLGQVRHSQLIIHDRQFPIMTPVPAPSSKYLIFLASCAILVMRFLN